MTNPQNAIYPAQLRMAQHYLDKLRQAENAVRRGRESRAHWLNQIRRDWEQIKQWQAWSVGGQNTDVKRARLCAAFSLITPDILQVQLTPIEHLSWSQQALDVVRRLKDHNTERTLLYRAAFISLTLERIEQAEEYAQQLIEHAQATEDSLSTGRAWYILATISFTRGVYDRAEEYYASSIAQFEACHAVEEIPIVWRGLGRVSMFQGNYQKGQMYHQKYLDASVGTGNEQGILDAHISLSGIFISLRDYKSAEHHAEHALALARPLGKWRLLPAALFSLAHAQKWQGKYETASNHYEEGISVARDVGTAPSNIANGLYGLAQARYLQGDYRAAVKHFEEALEIARSARLVFRVCQISHDMVLAYIALDQMEAARARLKEALSSAQQLNTPQFMSKALAAAIIVWQHSGELEQAALWAGLLSSYIQLLHPSLFDSAIYEQLEVNLGAECFRDAMERGKLLNLENVVSEILTLLV